MALIQQGIDMRLFFASLSLAQKLRGDDRVVLIAEHNA